MNDRKLLEALVSKYGKTALLNEISLATARSAANKAKELGRTKQEGMFTQYVSEKEHKYFEDMYERLFDDETKFITEFEINDRVIYGTVVIGQTYEIPAVYIEHDGLSLAIDEEQCYDICASSLHDILSYDKALAHDFNANFNQYFRDLINYGDMDDEPVHFIEDIDYFFKQLKNTCDKKSTARVLARKFVEQCNELGVPYKGRALGEQLADWHYYARL